MDHKKSSFPLLAIRGSHGIDLLEIGGNKSITNKYNISNRICRVMKFSNSGRKFAWCDGELVQVIDVISKEVLFSKQLSRTYVMKFSPDERVLVTWEPYAVTKEFPNGKANLQFWNLNTSECMHQFIQKKLDGWEPIWIDHFKVCAKHAGNVVNFYKDNNFSQIASKLRIEKMEGFAVSPNPKPPTRIACFVRGAKGAPSSVRIFKYPKFNHADVIANKSFFKADTCDLIWNKQGTGLLVKTALEVDSTGESYYGEQNLHFLSSNGDSAIVTLSKKGPIYDAAWAPTSVQFCVVFGYMPAKACVFNLKCDPVFEFGSTPKNLCYFNPHGNLLVLAGFGNLRGNMEVWDFEKKQQIAQFQSPDTTQFEWCGDGAYFATATTAPRLRVDNGFKLWHFKDGVIFEKKSERELHQIEWESQPEGTYPAPVIGKISQKEVKAAISASKPVTYIPPHARGDPNYAAKCRLDDEDKPAEETLSKSALKKQRRKERDAANKASAPGPSFTLPSSRTSEQQDAVAMARYLLSDAPAPVNTSNSNASNFSSDVDKKKYIKNIRKKLTAIEKLKQEQKDGKVLERQQLEKIQNESALRAELEKLQV